VRNLINVAALGGVTEYNTAAIFAPVRYYASALPALALLLAGGLFWLAETVIRAVRVPPARRPALAGVPAFGLAALWLVVGMAGGIALSERPALTIGGAALAGTTPLDAPQPNSGPNLVAAQAQPQLDTGTIAVRLVSQRAAVPAGPDVPDAGGWIARFELRDAAGALAARCEVLPANGWQPVETWPPEQPVALDVNIPICTEPAGTLTLMAQWVPLAEDGAVDAVHLGDTSASRIGTYTAAAAVPRAAGCPPLYGVFTPSDAVHEADGLYVLQQYIAPARVQRGALFIPSVNWGVQERAPTLAGRVYTFTHETSGAVYTCDVSDQLPGSWPRGARVFFDRCAFTFPNDAPTGAYRVTVRLIDTAGAPFTARDGLGDELPGGDFPLGTLQVE
jgi:hypothetical protein